VPETSPPKADAPDIGRKQPEGLLNRALLSGIASRRSFDPVPICQTNSSFPTCLPPLISASGSGEAGAAGPAPDVSRLLNLGLFNLDLCNRALIANLKALEII